jgi:glycosyltransferase involved in cell wall biosynthesis
MKVAVIASGTLPSIKANTLQVMKMTEAFKSIGHEVHLIIPDSGGSKISAERKWENFADLYGIQDQFAMTWLPIHKRFRKYDFAWNAVRWSRNWGSDVIFTRLPQAAAIAAQRGLLTIFEIHDLPQGIFGPIMVRFFLKGKGARKLVTISKALADDLVQDNYLPPDNRKHVILPDGVDLRRYVDLPPALESRKILSPEINQRLLINGEFYSEQQFTAGYTGHLYPGRGVPLMLDIAERLPGINILIVGGEDQDIRLLLEQVKGRKIENILLTGFVPNADLPKYQAACDVLLMPYQSKVAASSGGDIGRYLSPMKLFEYLACGRAICSSDLPVLQEVLSPETAVLLPPDDIDSWVQAIQELISNPSYRNKLANNAKAAAQKYSWESRARRILAEASLFN